MACALKRSDLTSEQYGTLVSMLTMTPVIPNSRFNKNKTVESIDFFRKQGDYIHVPFTFASSLTKRIPNQDIIYPKMEFKFTGELRENQIPVETEAYRQLCKHKTTTLALFPGFGKTILGAAAACRIKSLTCVLVHREILTTQWKNTFEKVTNAQVWIVGEKSPPKTCHIIICMDTRWHLIDKKVRDMVRFLIIDECHSFCTPDKVDCLLAFHPSEIMLESATIMRDDEMHNMMYAIAGTHNITRECNKPFNVIKLVTNIKPERRTRYGHIDYHHLVNTTLFNERRNDIILQTVLKNKDFKILILTSLVNHTHLLYELINKAQIPCDYLCGTKKSYHDGTVLIGTTSKIGTGFDAASSCATYDGRPFDLLLLVCSIKKYAALVQNIGRVLRATNPTLIHFVDDDNIYTGHWYKAQRWYKSCGGVVNIHRIPGPTQLDDEQLQNKWVTDRIKKLKQKK